MIGGALSEMNADCLLPRVSAVAGPQIVPLGRLLSASAENFKVVRRMISDEKLTSL